ncbi:TetR/AcrR family transcriptional regulator [Amycolatopsis sp. CA-230715]|uniref:TetR/AcrR family transcriptional regulator n=1 Tax=Amycolatopsis sp. CA-230715 TaxID=2745196 RepID=UPI002F41C3AF
MEHSGGGDPDRTLALLWRDRDAGPAEPARGRKPRFTIDEVVDAAVKLADANGMAATSMHCVAKALGVGTMTLYTYVPSKEELIDLMLDVVLRERAFPRPGEPRPEDWRDQVRLYADRTRAMYRRHPWVREVSMIRPSLGPGMMAGNEYLLSTMANLGLSPRDLAAAANAVAGLIESAAGVEAGRARLEQLTGETEDTWWQRRSSFWEKYFDVTEHPTIVQVWNDGGYDDSATDQSSCAFAFGLERILDGIASIVSTVDTAD